jgi:hypothetical protein
MKAYAGQLLSAFLNNQNFAMTIGKPRRAVMYVLSSAANAWGHSPHVAGLAITAYEA